MIEVANHADSSTESGSSPLFGSLTTSFFDGISNQTPASWERLVRVYGPVVFCWCRRDGLTEDEAADIGQEVFRAILTGIHRFDDSLQNAFIRWLRTITRNKVCDFYRLRSKAPVVVGGTDFQDVIHEMPSPEVTVDTKSEEQDALTHFILTEIQSEFTPKTWKAFWETAVNNRLSTDVAEDLGMTSVAVRKAKSRVLRRLRKALEDQAQDN